MKKNLKNPFDDLKDLVNDSTTYLSVGHIFRGDEDVCLKHFGEQDEECIKHNALRQPKHT